MQGNEISRCTDASGVGKNCFATRKTQNALYGSRKSPNFIGFTWDFHLNLYCPKSGILDFASAGCKLIFDSRRACTARYFVSLNFMGRLSKLAGRFWWNNHREQHFENAIFESFENFGKWSWKFRIFRKFSIFQIFENFHVFRKNAKSIFSMMKKYFSLRIFCGS
mgnify:CR=1 FL=1